MGLFRPTAERRSISFQEVWGSGADVINGDSVERALTLVPVYAATSRIAGDVASLPLHAFRSSGDDVSQKITAPSLVRDPTMFGTQFDWVHRAMTSLLLRGNAYGLITEVDGMGFPTRIEWLNPDEVSVDDDRAVTRPTFRWLGQVISPQDLVHIPWYTRPGRVLGLSPIKAFALQLDTGLLAQKFGRDFFQNNGHPSAVLRNKGGREYDEDGAKRIKKRFLDSVRGREPAILTGDWEYEAIQIAPEESQFIQTLKLNATQVASIYGIAPEYIGGETGSSMTYQNVESQSIQYVQFTLRRWVVKLEEAISRLLPERVFVLFHVDSLIRADINARHRAHQVAIQSGWLSVNDVRKRENLPPIENGDNYLWPPMRMQLSSLELEFGADDESGQRDAMDALELEMQRLEAEAQPQPVGVAAPSTNGASDNDL